MKLRKVAKLSEAELGAIFAALATEIRTYSQVVEVSGYLGTGDLGCTLMTALDVYAAVHGRTGTYRQWVVAPAPSNPR
jgi:3-methyladenine DNA glycosylase Mpg